MIRLILSRSFNQYKNQIKVNVDNQLNELRVRNIKESIPHKALMGKGNIQDEKRKLNKRAGNARKKRITGKYPFKSAMRLDGPSLRYPRAVVEQTARFICQPSAWKCVRIIDNAVTLAKANKT